MNGSPTRAVCPRIPLAFNRGNGSNVAKAELVSPMSVAWGKTSCEGSRSLHIVDCGAASSHVERRGYQTPAGKAIPPRDWA